MQKLLIFVFLTYCFQSFAHINSRTDGHAPIGVMADHSHKAGEWMVSYRVMDMSMEGLQDGTDDISTEELFDQTNFMMSPEKMKMIMHMAGIMYAPSDEWTFMVMLPYAEKSMDMSRKMQGDTLTSEVSGIGDITVSAMRTFFETEDERFLAALGLSLPTGSIDEEVNGNRVAYPMQSGAGTFRFKPSVTYSKYLEEFSYGAQASMNLGVNKNKYGYKKGDEIILNLWGAYLINDDVSASLRLEHRHRGAISGEDEELNRMMSPGNIAENHSGNRQSIYAGMNYMPKEILPGHRFAFEVGIPFRQDVNGPQMKNKYVFVLGWQKSWKE